MLPVVIRTMFFTATSYKGSLIVYCLQLGMLIHRIDQHPKPLYQTQTAAARVTKGPTSIRSRCVSQDTASSFSSSCKQNPPFGSVHLERRSYTHSYNSIHIRAQIHTFSSYVCLPGLGCMYAFIHEVMGCIPNPALHA